MASLEVTKRWLEEAEMALHQLAIGERETIVLVGGFGKTEYSEVSINELETYIAKLKRDIAKLELGRARRPILIQF